MALALNRTVIIEKTGEKMLQGWKLLSLHCPICNTALLSKKMEMFCVSCDMNVITEAEYTNDPNSFSTSVDYANSYEDVNSDIITNIDSQCPYNINIIEEDVNSLIGQECDEEIGSNTDFHASRKKMDEVSKKLGQKMLSGWALLGEICPSILCSGTPLMSQKEGPLLCVCCNMEYIRGSQGELVVSGTKHVHFDANVNEINIDVPSSSNASSLLKIDFDNSSLLLSQPVESNTIKEEESLTSEDVSKLISDKLLSGWALLDDSCQSPTCRGEVPLMRNKKGEKICLKCANTSSSSSAITTGKRHRETNMSTLPSTHAILPPPPSPPPATEYDRNQLIYGSRGRYAAAKSLSTISLNSNKNNLDVTDAKKDVNVNTNIPIAIPSHYSEEKVQPLHQGSSTGINGSTSNTPTAFTLSLDIPVKALCILQQKMEDVSLNLERENQPSDIIELADTLRILVDTIISVKRLLG